MIEQRKPDLREILDEVLSRLLPEDVFTDPAHKFQKDPKKCRGGCPWHQSKSETSFNLNPQRLLWYCPACNLGGGPVQYLWKLQGGAGTSPRGRDFVEIVKRLCALANYPFPELELTEEEKELARNRSARQAILSAAAHICQEELWGERGIQAREYLHRRGFADDQIKELDLGLFPALPALKTQLEKQGHASQDVQASGVAYTKMAGYATFPWLDDRGFPLTIYGSWPGHVTSDRPKKMALPNPVDRNGDDVERTKRSPLYLDRALFNGCTELVLVEGVIDAALLQVKGDHRAIACVGAQLTALQVQTLKKRQIRSVIICLDPDTAGENGILSCIRSLKDVRIGAYVAPRLPDGQDPDEYVLAHGMDSWRSHISRKTHAYKHVAVGIIKNVGERQPGDDSWSDSVVDAALEYALRLPTDRSEELARHYWPEIAAATGSSTELLIGRLSMRRDEIQRTKGSGLLNGSSRPVAEGKRPGQGYRFQPIDSATFAAADYSLKWLICRLLIRNMPAIVGGPKKALKTSLLLDLILSLASGTPFLGKFQVYQKVRLAVLSGESGPFTLQETARRICEAKGIDLASLDCFWDFKLPQLGTLADLSELRRGLEAQAIEVLLIDPLYLCLLSGEEAKDKQATNLFDMGPLLLNVAQCCLEVSCTPILIHHAR
ncbi:MAG: AAA family ATPase [Gemmataceae bacterium]